MTGVLAPRRMPFFFCKL